MDTRFWGPPGWKLLHQISYKYPDKPTDIQKLDYGIFYSNLAFVLPCKYCRNSFTKYIKNLPVEGYLDCKSKLTEWVYLMHNKVNGKLRRQGLLTTPNPSFKEISERYEECAKEKCQLPGWDFIYAMVFNYPKENPAPSLASAYLTFFTYLGKVIPCEEYRDLYNKYFDKDPLKNHLMTQDSLIKWIYNINCKINTKLNEDTKSFNKLCSFYETFKAGSCKKKNHKGKTCRKKSLKIPESKENLKLRLDNENLEKKTKKKSKH
jgi:hypothetical protein